MLNNERNDFLNTISDLQSKTHELENMIEKLKKSQNINNNNINKENNNVNNVNNYNNNIDNNNNNNINNNINANYNITYEHLTPAHKSSSPDCDMSDNPSVCVSFMSSAYNERLGLDLAKSISIHPNQSPNIVNHGVKFLINDINLNNNPNNYKSIENLNPK